MRKIRTLIPVAFIIFSALNPLSARAVDQVSTVDYSLISRTGLVGSSNTNPAIGGNYPIQKPDIKNIDKIPTSEDLDLVPYINRSTLLSMLNSKEVSHIYIESAEIAPRVAVVSTGGVISKVYYDDLLVEDITKVGFLPKYVVFKTSSKNTIKTVDDGKGFSRFYTKVFVPLLLLGGGLWIYKRRYHKVKVKVGEGETAYETRSGDGGVIPTVKFSDVAGCEEAIEDLKELADFLKDPTKFHELGAKVPRGAILAGPPGTGKTLLARAVAGEAGVPFFSAAGSDFVEMYVGVGAARVRDLFNKARKSEKAIIFIDEIDAVAKVRSGGGHQSGNEERDNTLNALLHELDGFSRSNVILLAATNMIESLDPAITRPGRLDRKISVPKPDRVGREAILNIHSKGIPLDNDVDLGLISRRTPGMSGADLSQICNEAAIEAARRNLKKVNASCFSDAVALVAMGRARKSAVVTDRDRLITAWHEAGHTICALRHHDAPNPVSVSITPRGHAGGITWMSGSDDNYLARSQAAAQLVVAMGGRAAEELLLDGEFTQGPSSDLERATNLAKAMVTQYGMTRRGLMVRHNERDGDTGEVIEELLKEALVDARELLIANKPLLEAVVDSLLVNETLEYSEILEIESSISPENHIGNNHRAGQRTMSILRDVSHASIEAVADVASDAIEIGLNTFKAGVNAFSKVGGKDKKINKERGKILAVVDKTATINEESSLNEIAKPKIKKDARKPKLGLKKESKKLTDAKGSVAMKSSKSSNVKKGSQPRSKSLKKDNKAKNSKKS